MTKTVGILSTGDMGAAIGSVLRASGVDVATSLAGRSELTRLRAVEANIRDAGSVRQLVEQCETLLSVLVPSCAIGIAEEVADALSGTNARPVFVECNAIAPRTVGRVATLIRDAGGTIIDAGIIGAPPRHGSKTRFYYSGPDTSAFESLGEHGLDIRWTGTEIGQASGLKMIYAASTKGPTAIWTQLLVAAEAMGLKNILLAEYGLAEEPARHIKMTTEMPRRARRWIGEMEEIAATFEHLGMTRRLFEGVADMYRFVGDTDLANQTSREPDPDLDQMLRVLARAARMGD